MVKIIIPLSVSKLLSDLIVFSGLAKCSITSNNKMASNFFEDENVVISDAKNDILFF